MNAPKEKAASPGRDIAAYKSHYRKNFNRRLLFRQAQVTSAFLFLASTSGTGSTMLLASFIQWVTA